VPASALEANSPFTFENSGGLPFYLKARLTGLPANAQLFYQVGCSEGGSPLSPVLVTKTLSSSPRILLWGDMGRDSGEEILPALYAEVAKAEAGAADAAEMCVCAGDYGYDLQDEAGARGARFMNRLQNISSMFPTVTTMGNHEASSGNASHYTNILGRAMAGDALGHWFSFSAGLIHFVMLSSEVYHMAPFTLQRSDGSSLNVSSAAQLAWLQQDLAAVDRAVTPWLVAVYHRPFYCSNADGDECSNTPLNWPANPLRVDLEPVFMQHGVDLCIQAHEHSVELIYPLVNGQVERKNYSEARAPIHWVTGAAGCNEDSGFCQNPILLPSPFTDRYLWGLQQYSYSRMWAVNSSVLHVEQVKVLPEPSIWAAIDIVQHNHGPFV
jgi:hypothetical protein